MPLPVKPLPVKPNPKSRPGVVQPKGNAFAVNLRPKAGGQPLPDAVRSKMERAFNADFSDVRVHVGHEARQIGAIAFAWGSDLHFAPGQYNPHSLQGQKLLGHELAHVVQQRAGRVRNPLGAGVAVVDDPALEAEADRMGLRSALMPAAKPAVQPKRAPAAPPAVQRYAVGPARVSPQGARTLTVHASGSRQPVGSVRLWAREGGVAEITDLQVSPEHRRHGVGKTLVNAAIQAARQQGLGKARLEARPSDSGIRPHVLVNMYQRLGFRSIGVSPRGAPLMERSTR
jgi:ribosomal protein S18 acetylase RimI-like enzyme